MSRQHIRKSSTSTKDGEEAIKYLAKELDSKESKLSILFVSSSYDLKKIEPYILEYMGENVVACTTAGEIGKEGYCADSISGISFLGDDFETTVLDIPSLDYFTQDLAKVLRAKTLESIAAHNRSVENGKTFAMLLVDGLAMKEESTTGTLSHVLPADIPLIGASAGDGLNFEATYVYFKGKFQTNRAVVVLVTTSIPFEVFKIQHFAESDIKMVITEADPENRVVKEIDGEPAAEAYARLLEVPISEFGPKIYSKHPIMLNVGGTNYVRSIQKVNEDKSLTFYCAIEEGLVLTLANKTSIVENVKELFIDMKNKLGALDSCILFECILRRLEVLDLTECERKEIMSLYSENNAVGFHTYGEQFGSIHINQTITGIAFGRK